MKRTEQHATESLEARGQIVLDTCVLLNDPDAILEYNDQLIVLPLTVVEELDKHKHRPDAVGWAARQSLRNIENLRREAGGDLRVPAPIAHGWLRVETNGLHRERVHDLGLDTDRADNRILAACLGLADHGPVTLVSSDAAMRLKAAQLGLRAEDYERHQHVDAIGAGWSTIEVDTEIIDEVHERNQIELELVDCETKPALNQFCVLTTDTTRQSALVQRRGDRLVRLRHEPEMWGIRPRNKEQRFALELLNDPAVEVVVLAGQAGTGKTLLALAAALEQSVNENRYDGVSIYRPVIPAGRGQDLGFLPGDLDEKLDAWAAPILDALVALSERKNLRDAMKMREELEQRGKFEMGSIAHIRGRSVTRRVLLIDEAQNLEPAAAKLLLTRVGEGSKVILCGDPSQIDANYLSSTNNALSAVVNAFTGSEVFGYVKLTRGERSRVADLAADLL